MMPVVTELNDYGVLLKRPLHTTEVQQLELLLAAFEKFVDRNHHYRDLWMQGGAADSAHHIKSKTARIVWSLDRLREGHPLDADDALDLINYAAFFVRNARAGRIDASV